VNIKTFSSTYISLSSTYIASNTVQSTTAIDLANMATANNTVDQGVKNGESVQQAPALTTDPFVGQRETVNPFSNGETAKAASPSSSPVDRRTSSDEWDAAKTPPSRFQQRKGSVYATPGSRDGHVDKNYARDAKFHELVDKKYGSGKRRSSTSKEEKRLSTTEREKSEV